MIHAPVFDVRGKLLPCRGLEIELARLAKLCSKCAGADLRYKETGELAMEDVRHLNEEGYIATIHKFQTVTELLKEMEDKTGDTP